MHNALTRYVLQRFPSRPLDAQQARARCAVLKKELGLSVPIAL